ncbi:MAG: TraR/DksA C4-type zinc finger protein [Patescibacteria group bacterium]|nr:TraR/DksA C4-type zinc finger protein [Patescibacteria group bacterium]
MTHMTIDIPHFKMLLQNERERLLRELAGLGHVNPANVSDWEATPEDRDTMRADKNEAADAVEEYESRAAVEVTLENHLQNITAALERIENNTYGVCRIGGEAIEEDRLEANPAATTCKAHLEE